MVSALYFMLYSIKCFLFSHHHFLLLFFVKYVKILLSGDMLPEILNDTENNYGCY